MRWTRAGFLPWRISLCWKRIPPLSHCRTSGVITFTMGGMWGTLRTMTPGSINSIKSILTLPSDLRNTVPTQQSGFSRLSRKRGIIQRATRLSIMSTCLKCWRPDPISGVLTYGICLNLPLPAGTKREIRERTTRG